MLHINRKSSSLRGYLREDVAPPRVMLVLLALVLHSALGVPGSATTGRALGDTQIRGRTKQKNDRPIANRLPPSNAMQASTYAYLLSLLCHVHLRLYWWVRLISHAVYLLSSSSFPSLHRAPFPQPPDSLQASLLANVREPAIVMQRKTVFA